MVYRNNALMPPDDELARYLATLDHADLVRRLRSLAGRDDSLRFEVQIAAIRELYARRTRLLKRMDKAGLS
jgi:hypothetical protein